MKRLLWLLLTLFIIVLSGCTKEPVVTTYCVECKFANANTVSVCNLTDYDADQYIIYTQTTANVNTGAALCTKTAQ